MNESIFPYIPYLGTGPEIDDNPLLEIGKLGEVFSKFSFSLKANEEPIRTDNIEAKVIELINEYKNFYNEETEKEQNKTNRGASSHLNKLKQNFLPSNY